MQTDLEMHDVMSFQEHFDEVTRLEYVMDNEMISLNQRLRAQEQQHRANPHNLTQAPVFYTKNGHCWHADPECLRKYATQEIYEKNYCTRCSHVLGGILEPDHEPSAAGSDD